MANRLLTINIRKYLTKQPRRKRPARMSRYVRHRISKSTNIRLDNIKISKELNSIMLKKYLHSMKPLKVSISIEKEKATVTYFDKTAKPVAEVKAKEAKPDAKTPAAQQKAQPQEPKKVSESKTNSKEVKN